MTGKMRTKGEVAGEQSRHPVSGDLGKTLDGYLGELEVTERQLIEKWTSPGGWYSDVRRSQTEGKPSVGALALERFIEEREKYRGTVYRGVNLSAGDLGRYAIVGKIISQQDAISSWSKDLGVSREFATETGSGKPVVFVCEESTRGVYIGEYSLFGEEEVIMSSKARWTVLNVDERDGITFITVEEV